MFYYMILHIDVFEGWVEKIVFLMFTLVTVLFPSFILINWFGFMFLNTCVLRVFDQVIAISSIMVACPMPISLLKAEDPKLPPEFTSL
ncbi:hypothetical protein D3C84_1129680 [compost metagenome]